VRAWFEREATLLDLGAVAAVVLAAIAGFAILSSPVGPRLHPAAARPVGASLSPDRVQALLELPEAQRVPAGIEILSRPEPAFAPGAPMHVRVTVRAPARIVVLDQPASGPAEQVWPGLGQAPALLQRPSSSGPAVQQLQLEAAASAGQHRLRLVVAPEDLDLGALSPEDFARAADRLTLVDLRYEVTSK
jgi:hypothetical protein